MNFRLRLGQIWFVTSAEEDISSARGLHKNAHFFPNFFKHRILHFSDFQLHVSTTNMYAYVYCMIVPPSLIFSTDCFLELSLPWRAEFHCSSMTT